jgi:hypothetical protein
VYGIVVEQRELEVPWIVGMPVAEKEFEEKGNHQYGSGKVVAVVQRTCSGKLG